MTAPASERLELIERVAQGLGLYVERQEFRCPSCSGSWYRWLGVQDGYQCDSPTDDRGNVCERLLGPSLDPWRVLILSERAT